MNRRLAAVDKSLRTNQGHTVMVWREFDETDEQALRRHGQVTGQSLVADDDQVVILSWIDPTETALPSQAD